MERAFFEHGLPFANESMPNAKPNPYLKPKQQSFLGLPRAKEHELDRHLRALLTAVNSNPFSDRVVYVFDSAASLRRARQLLPGMFSDQTERRTVHSNSTETSGCIMHRENLIAESTYYECARVRAILADLR